MNFGAAVDVAIGLILLYLLLGLIVASGNEFVAQIFDMRARHLKGALSAMVSGRTNDGKAALDKLLEHPFLAVAGKVSRSGPFGFAAGFGTYVPSYLKTADFASALGSTIRATALPEAIAAVVARLPVGDLKTRLQATTPDRIVAAVRDLADGADEAKLKALLSLDLGGAIDHLPDGDFRSTLQALRAKAAASATGVEKEIEAWFDTMMERVSGAYKRSMNIVGLLIGLGLAIAINADTFRIGETLWKDEALRASVVKFADGYLDCRKLAGTEKDKAKACDAPETAWGTLQKLPIGWGDATWATLWTEGGLARAILGWLVTALALSLGAPFWFDMLSKAMNLRAALSPQQASSRAAKTRSGNP